MAHKHEEKTCKVMMCGEPAKYFIDNIDRKINRPFDTFYLCQEHLDLVANENAQYAYFDDDGFACATDIAVYNCHKECRECND